MTLQLEHVSLAASGPPIILDVSLELERGINNVLLGPTLSGKTTLMRLMAGLDAPTSGRVRFDGVDVTGVAVRRRSVAMVYQQFINYPTLSVFENIASPLRVARLPKAEIVARVTHAARLLHLETLLERTPGALSGGQQQRTALARALVKRAQLVLLDEPLANLDYKLREELREELPRIFAETGAVFVYATTEPTEALLLGGVTVTLWQGRITQAGPAASVYRRPDNLDAARVYSDPPLNELVVEKRGARLTTTAGRDLPMPAIAAGLADGRYTFAFRAEELAIGAAGGARLSFPGQVSVTEIGGSESFVHVDVGLATWIGVIPGVRAFAPGAEVEASVDPQRLFVFDAAGALARAPAMAASA